MRYLEVKPSKPLRGKVVIPGSKNSALAILVACCMTTGTSKIKNVPDILDIRILLEIAEEIGMEAKKEGEFVYLNSKKLRSAELNTTKTKLYRASYYFIGALIHKFKRVKIGYPGGDDFGSRPIDQHIKGLKALGCKVKFEKEFFIVEADELVGNEIYFDMKTSGATINLILTGVFAKGQTILRNAATDPEVVDIVKFLNKMGANIKGAGTGTITISGVKELNPCEYSIIPDRLIAGSLLMAAGITKGSIELKEIIPEHMESCVQKLREIGMNIVIKENIIFGEFIKDFQSTRVVTNMYPGFPTDLQQPLTALLIKAFGKSVVTENVYKNRFGHIPELNKMGANITILDSSAVIYGHQILRGTWVNATDIRAGICLIISALVAEGDTMITGIEHFERGYPDIVNMFNSLGAELKVVNRDYYEEDNAI